MVRRLGRAAQEEARQGRLTYKAFLLLAHCCFACQLRLTTTTLPWVVTVRIHHNSLYQVSFMGKIPFLLVAFKRQPHFSSPPKRSHPN